MPSSASRVLYRCRSGRYSSRTGWPIERKKHNFALRVRLKNKEALRRYQEDEGHKLLLKETIVPILSELPPTAVDFESTLVM
mmetsp:Transcript_14457/g.24104  ORF Transcript_14457/g.24104 Transcript_14457/m.24104 type:complete len:82 (+) Transcript_14457:255-500(+)